MDKAAPLEEDLPKLYLELFECFSAKYFVDTGQPKFHPELDKESGTLENALRDAFIGKFTQAPPPLLSVFSKKEPFQTVAVSIRDFIEYKFVCKNIFKTAKFERQVGKERLPPSREQVIAPLMHFIVNDISDSDYTPDELVHLTTSLLRVFRWCSITNLNFKLYLAFVCDDIILALIRGICEKNKVSLTAAALAKSIVQVTSPKYNWTLQAKRDKREVNVVFEVDSSFNATCSIQEVDPAFVFLGGTRKAFRSKPF